MVGNVAEWTASCIPSRAADSQECNRYLHAGGAWSFIAAKIDLPQLADQDPDSRANYVGMRLARARR